MRPYFCDVDPRFSRMARKYSATGTTCIVPQPTQLVFLDFIGYVSHAKAAADALIVTNSTAVAVWLSSNRFESLKCYEIQKMYENDINHCLIWTRDFCANNCHLIMFWISFHLRESNRNEITRHGHVRWTGLADIRHCISNNITLSTSPFRQF